MTQKSWSKCGPFILIFQLYFKNQTPFLLIKIYVTADYSISIYNTSDSGFVYNFTNFSSRIIWFVTILQRLIFIQKLELLVRMVSWLIRVFKSFKFGIQVKSAKSAGLICKISWNLKLESKKAFLFPVSGLFC